MVRLSRTALKALRRRVIADSNSDKVPQAVKRRNYLRYVNALKRDR